MEGTKEILIDTREYFVNGNYFKEFPDKVLGSPYQASGRFGPVTKYKGSIKDVGRIEADTDFIGAAKASNNSLVSIQKRDKGKIATNKTAKQNRENAIRQSEKDLTKKAMKAEMGQPENMLSFKEVYEQNNPEISLGELRAFLWYKNSIGQPMSKDWYDLAYPDEVPSLQPDIKWIQEHYLCPFEGKLIPGYLFFAENIYEKKAITDRDKESIITQYGQEVYDSLSARLKSVYLSQYNQRLTLDDQDRENRLVLLPTSEFAENFYIRTLDDDAPFRWRASKRKKDFGEPDWLYAGALYDYQKTEFPELNLRDAFIYWLITGAYEVRANVTYVDIIRYYIFKQQKPRSKDPDDVTVIAREKAEWSRLKENVKTEGDRLFAQFLALQLKEEDKQRLEQEWNTSFNGYVEIDYNKIPVAFRLSSEYKGEPMEILPEKREGVAFMFNEGSGCIAYDVGVGKTWTALFAIRQMMDAGYCSRPLVIVPNQVYKQFIAEAKELMPDLTINALYNLGADYIDEIRGENGTILPVDEGSLTFMTYQGFERIGFSDETADSILDELHEILNQGDPAKMRKQAALREKLETLIGKGLKGTRINIEDLGIDFMAWDEAHALKKVFTSVKGKTNEEGGREKNDYEISSGTPSSRALKGFMLAQYVQRNNNNRNIMLLTATPFTNSPLEIYSVLSMIAYESLRKQNLNNLQNFFDNYIDVNTELTINSKMKPVRKQVVLGFNNIVSLRKLIRRYILHKTGEEANVSRPDKIVLPYDKKVVDGQVIKLSAEERAECYLQMTPLQEELMEQILSYAEGKEKLEAICTGITYTSDRPEDDETPVEELEDEFLSSGEQDTARVIRALNYARNLALSPYLYECSGLGQPKTGVEYVESSPKLMYIMKCIKSVKEHHEANNTPVSGQVIYMDRGVAYFELIIDYLVNEVGYKPHEVGIIRSQMPKKKDKEWVKNRFNGEEYDEASMTYKKIPDSDRMKVIIGSSTIKEGINLQRYGTVLYNAFVDWNPTDEIQLEGRIWRKGNEYGWVRIVIPLMVDSMDMFIFQKLYEKTERINSIWSRGGKNTLRLEDIDPSEIKNNLIKDPLLLAEIQTVDQVKQLDDDIASFRSIIRRAEAIKTMQSFIDYQSKGVFEMVEKYRPRKQPQNIEQAVSIMQEVFKSMKDEQGLKMVYRYQRENQSDKEYSPLDPPSKPYYWTELVANVRGLKKERDNFLNPRSLKVEYIDAFIQEQENEIEKLQAEKKRVGGPEMIQMRALEIEAERKAMEIRPKSINEVVKDFEKYNYLLDSREIIEVTMPSLSCPPVDADGKRRIDTEALDFLDQCIDQQPETKLLYFENDEYTPARKKLHEKIIGEFLKGKTCVEHGKPIAVLTGGAPGSGKSRYLRSHAPYLQSKDVYQIDADEVRAKLPEYKGWNASTTHLETKDIVNKMIDRIGGPCKFDLIWDGTMNKAKNYIPLIERLHNLGYEVFIIFIEVPKNLSIERTLKRYQRTGRYVPREVIDDFYKKEKKALNELKKMVDGYVVINGQTMDVIDGGGKQIPEDRNYKALGRGVQKRTERERLAEAQAQELELLELELELEMPQPIKELEFVQDSGRTYPNLEKEAKVDIIFDYTEQMYDLMPVDNPASMKVGETTTIPSKSGEIELSYRKADIPDVEVYHPAVIVDWIREQYGKSIDVQESFMVILLNNLNKIIGYFVPFKGSVSATVVDPRIVIGTAAKALASGMIIVHNHPSGNIQPSAADIQMTKKLESLCKPMDVDFLDHIIITKKSYSSLADMGHL